MSRQSDVETMSNPISLDGNDVVSTIHFPFLTGSSFHARRRGAEAAIVTPHTTFTSVIERHRFQGNFLEVDFGIERILFRNRERNFSVGSG